MEVFVPPVPVIRRLQEAEPGYYWSACAVAILRKHGFLTARVCTEGRPGRGFGIVLRQHPWRREFADGCLVFEGPLEPEVARRLGVETYPLTARKLTLLDAGQQPQGSLGYPTFTVRRIPTRARTPFPPPYPFQSPDRLWNRTRIEAQGLRETDGWSAVAYAVADDQGQPHPVALRKGPHLVLGIPVFDLVGRIHTFPPSEAGYFNMTESYYPFHLEGWLLNALAGHFVRGGQAVWKADRWPEGCHAAFSVRHDYDRPISRASLDELLDFYDGRALRSSWGWLTKTTWGWRKSIIDPDNMRHVHRRGHEVVLHATQPTARGFARELRRLERAGQLTIAGYTAHGGGGSVGYIGMSQYLWAEANGLLYGETMGNVNGLPYPAPVVRDGVPALSRLVLPGKHYSLDITMKPHEHALDALRRDIPRALRDGGHVVVMNHPDIHRAELYQLLSELDLAGVWCATFREVCAWCKGLKFSSRAEERPEGLHLRLRQPLSRPGRVRRLSPEGEVSFPVPAGASELVLSVPGRRAGEADAGAVARAG